MISIETLVPERLWQAIQPLLPVPAPAARSPAGGGCGTGNAPSVWRRLHQVLLDQLGRDGRLDWSRASLDSLSVRAQAGACLTGPNPTDRGKAGSKYHLLVERGGIPLAVGLSAANTHDSVLLEAIVDSVAPVKGPAWAAGPALPTARQAQPG
jgi:hypothetical protein